MGIGWANKKRRDRKSKKRQERRNKPKKKQQIRYYLFYGIILIYGKICSKNKEIIRELKFREQIYEKK